ncbi:MAG: hypothetical protein JOZ31_24935 [Verrucomicrobia bacterium]|nr:hypothetical protein [Verrucomicrobiota bacterium]
MSGIPVRMVYGSLFKPTLNGVDSDASYHCWVEFFAPLGISPDHSNSRIAGRLTSGEIGGRG